MFRLKCVSLLFVLFFSSAAYAQLKNQFSFDALAEKIYLQTDNKIYTNESTIWFKALVTDAIELAPTKLSGVLYAELISPDERIVETKLIKIENGAGDGFFELNKDYTEGTYLLRAYTEWNKNFGESFFFKDYIQIFTSSQAPKPNPVKNVTIVEEQSNTRRIQASFDPLLIDPAHSKDLKVFLSLDEKKDTLSIKKSGSNGYILNYPVPAGCQFVTFQVETKNNVSYTRSIILTKDYLDLQFFPESGEMLHGLPCLLGFKALDSIGKGKQINGEIINSKGDVIALFRSNPLGMGTVRIAIADSSEQYLARVETISSKGIEKRTYPLPRAVAKGSMIAVVKNGDQIRCRVASNYLIDDSLAVRASCRGAVYYEVRGRLKNGAYEFGLPVTSFPEGLIAFTVMNDSLQPVAERLYFNERPETRLDLSVTSDKPVYSQREQTQLDIIAKNQAGLPANANLSVLVLNSEQLNKVLDTRQNILSYLLLSSDLKGTIEDPGYYFSADPARGSALDALLLTQGWRKYNYTRSEGKIHVQPEPALLVTGTVTGGLFTTKQKKGISLTMMTFGKPPSVDTQLSDSLGRFAFPVNDLFQQTVNVLIQTSNKAGVKKDYTITLDRKNVPPVQFDHVRSVESPDSVIQVYVKNSLSNKKKLDDYIARTEGVTLSEVIVKSYAMTPERKKVTDQYGAPKTVIEGDDIRKNEAKWSYGLYSVLLFNYPDKIRINRAYDGTLFAQAMNSEMTLVVIDGIPVRPYDYGLIPAIPPSEVKSVELIEYAKGFTSLYCELFPTSCLGAPPTGNIIAIYTYARIGLFGANRAPGLTKAAVPVFSTQREFYAPKYDQLKTEDWQKPDLRSLIHWAPKIQTDSAGHAKISFYNADLTGKTQVIIEAISPNGEIGYKRLTYDVIKRKEDR
ncbi:MAG: hypothetical protein DI535_00225 [Citrobacter freundii]|nr:MAG: hypothetical protein DI535_00225 [Citrobacter freundii]